MSDVDPFDCDRFDTPLVPRMPCSNESFSPSLCLYVSLSLSSTTLEPLSLASASLETLNVANNAVAHVQEVRLCAKKTAQYIQRSK